MTEIALALVIGAHVCFFGPADEGGVMGATIVQGPINDPRMIPQAPRVVVKADKNGFFYNLQVSDLFECQP